MTVGVALAAAVELDRYASVPDPGGMGEDVRPIADESARALRAVIASEDAGGLAVDEVTRAYLVGPTDALESLAGGCLDQPAQRSPPADPVDEGEGPGAADPEAVHRLVSPQPDGTPPPGRSGPIRGAD